MRIKANLWRFGERMWYGTARTKGGVRWRRHAKQMATRRDRQIARYHITED